MPRAVRLGGAVWSNAAGNDLLERLSWSDRFSIGSQLDVQEVGTRSEVCWKTPFGW